MTAPLTVLQITDSHLKASASSTLLGVDTADSLRAVLAQALAEQAPDAVIASGDLAHDPEPATYRRFEQALRDVYAGPVMYLAGNHDLSGPLAATLGTLDTLRLGSWAVIGFDTHRDHRTEAELDDVRRGALMARIGGWDAEHVLLVCHHHPLPVGCPWLDKDCIPLGFELLESCAAESRVRGLAFGHVHQEVRTEAAGLPVLGAPSTCFQFQPGSERFAIDRSPQSGRPGYRWLMLHPDGTLASRVRRVADYPLNIDVSDRS